MLQNDVNNFSSLSFNNLTHIIIHIKADNFIYFFKNYWISINFNNLCNQKLIKNIEYTNFICFYYVNYKL